MTEAIDLRDSKGTLSRVDAEATGGQHIKDLAEVEEMLLPGGAENEEIIKIDKKERKGTEKGVHEALECLGSIFKAKGHEVEFKETKRSDYCGFWNVVFMHGDLIITLFQIKFGENC
jgi:hypothetical protein